MLHDSRWSDDIFDEGQEAGMRRVRRRSICWSTRRVPADIEAAMERLSLADLDTAVAAALEATSLDDFRARLPGG
jgi:hypothetical protein